MVLIMWNIETIGEMELMKLARDRLEDLSQIETNDEQREIYEEQYEELCDVIARAEKDAGIGAISEVLRLSVEDKFGSWYYQKIRIRDEDDDSRYGTVVYNLYDNDGSFVDEFKGITSMKHYVRTGKRA